MSHELINLLPPSRIRAFRRNYFIRLATVALVLLTVLVVVNGVLLIPSYLYASDQARGEQLELGNTQGTAATSTSSAEAELTTLKNNGAYLARLGTTPSASGAVRAVLAVSHPGIALVNLTYTPPVGTNAASAKIVLSGTAATRDSLRAYDLALTGQPFIANVDLPISAYANESNISFTMTLTGTLNPTP